MGAPDFLADLWIAAKTAGPFATMFALLVWIKTDRERLRLQSERDALLERVLDSNDKIADAMAAAQSALAEQRRVQ